MGLTFVCVFVILQARQAKEAERNERLEQQRKERELKNQQALEVKTNKYENILDVVFKPYCFPSKQAKKKREEELARQKAEEAARKAQVCKVMHYDEVNFFLKGGQNYLF